MTELHKVHTGMSRVRRATHHSMDGLHSALRNEAAFRQELALAVVLLPASLWLGRTWVEVSLLAGSVLLVLIVELLNSGIEAVVDRVSLDRHELSKRAKDLGSAAVFVALLLCGWVWVGAIWHHMAAA